MTTIHSSGEHVLEQGLGLMHAIPAAEAVDLRGGAGLGGDQLGEDVAVGGLEGRGCAVIVAGLRP